MKASFILMFIVGLIIPVAGSAIESKSINVNTTLEGAPGAEARNSVEGNVSEEDLEAEMVEFEEFIEDHGTDADTVELELYDDVRAQSLDLGGSEETPGAKKPGTKK
ncbi:MAG: hypothetical protein AB7G93_14065 [Bdellovibrionales bacterium]